MDYSITEPKSKSSGGFNDITLLQNKLVYDSSYIYKYKNPTLSQMIDKINELINAVNSLQNVLTNVVESEMKEDRKVIDDIWKNVKKCCDELGIPYNDGDLWDGSGVVDEGISAYTCHLK